MYRERLWPATWVWAAAVSLAVVTGVAFWPVGGVAAAVVALLVATGAFAGLLAWWSPVVRVVEPTPTGGWWLQAGPARIPVSALVAPVALDPAAMRAALGPELDARSHRCIRGWVGTGVRVEVADERDPTPYWLVSSRRPGTVVAALVEAGVTAAGRAR